MKFQYFLLYIPVILLFSCTPLNMSQKDKTIKETLVKDPHSYSNTDEIRTEHLHLDLDVNFENNTIYGVARHQMSDNKADTAIFDIKALEIQKVTTGKESETETDFVIGKNDELLGQALKVKIKPVTKYINIYYKTTEKTEALDWLSPELTTGKKHPFLYTQGQAILTRSWIPVQDTPSNRVTYSANVKVPSELMAVMSATNPKRKNTKGEYHFEMDQKIPVYLIALAVGDLTYTSLGKNCGVYSEPELKSQCAYEFVDLPKMIRTAESIYGKYQWKQYDLIVLPYSFPFGGMENPRITFVNPTVMTGDRSLVSVIAHELAHSWSGNLVTNATWNDFWLNEGFTVYFENRIMERLYGKETANILAVIEYQELERSMENIENSEHPEDTQLKLQLENRNPDDGMTDIAYIKGAYFLRTLEKTVGRKKFDAFMKGYFNKHAFQTITTEDFLADLEEDLLKPNKIEFNAKEWIYTEGIPDNCVKITSKRLDQMKILAHRVATGEDIFKGKFRNMKREDYISQEWQAFIRELPDTINPERLKYIDEKLNFRDCNNVAIQSEWFLLAAKAGYQEVRPYMASYLCKIGRRWYIQGIYEELSKTEEDKNWAKKVFAEASKNYHYVSRSSIEEVLY